MSVFNENLGNRIIELLNYPVIERCTELGLICDRCSLRELQEVFPTLVNSIFGVNSSGLGWGLRTISRDNCPQVFDVLYNFLIPLGPMFRLCYRLLNDAVKFEFNIEFLPHKLTEMLQSGHYSMFYADLLNIDPFHRCITSLSLNAFDYFLLNFIIHGTFPLHKMYPAALQVHNDRIKTVYFFLTADYLCSFMPSNPDTIVMPTNICGSVKAPQPIPVQPLQPTRSPKYLKLSPISHYQAANQTSAATVIRAPESPRFYAWRTESVMYFFVDIWLRYDVDEAMELPSSEFIRVVRILVKQLHAFGNAAEIDQTSMSGLRKLAQPMMKSRIYPFLKSIISRWPLDSSLSVVLELWLSYIQPWRYTFDRHLSNNNTNLEIPITSKYEAFISENLGIYTQIFVQILPRFERLDFTSFRNVVMLHRLIKVFSQSTLPEILCDCELRYTNTNFPISSHQTSPIRHSPFYSRQRVECTGEWDTFRTDHFQPDEAYIPMFGDAIKSEIQQLIKTVYVAKMCIQQDIAAINDDIAKKYRGINYMKKIILYLFDDVTPEQSKLQEIRKIPDVLDMAVHSLSQVFEIELPNFQIEHIQQPRDLTYSQVNFSTCEDSDYFDVSRISPIQMRNNIANIKATIDPALLPIQGHECTFLVRFLHQVSCKLNEMFCNEIQNLWSRIDIWGKLSRQLLNPPMTVQWFDKSKGISELREEQLQPRICLRILASYKTLFLILLSIVFGKVLLGVPSFGLLLLTFCIFLYLFIVAFFS